MSTPYTIEFYRDNEGRDVVGDWLRSLSPTKKAVIGWAMYEVLEHRGSAVCDSEFGKQLGEGIFEFRVRSDSSSVCARKKLPPERVLLRVFCHAHGDKLVLLLGGFDKAEDPSHRSQSREIAEARQRLTAWRARQRD